MQHSKNVTWVGQWKNQYGSVLTIESEAGGRIEGSFKSAVDPSVKESAVIGVCANDLISFSAVGEGVGQKIASWTGILREGKIETLWHVVANEKLVAGEEGAPAKKTPAGIWEAFVTGSDIFQRV